MTCLHCPQTNTPRTTGDEKGFPRDPRRIGGGEEHREAGNVARLTNAAKWRLRFDLLLHVGLNDAGCMRSLRLDHPGFDGVDPNPARAELVGKNASDRVDCPFRAAIDRAVGKPECPGALADV